MHFYSTDHLALFLSLPFIATAAARPPPPPRQSPLSPIMPWGPTIDGSSHGLLRRPIVSIRRGAWNKVPLIIGTVFAHICMRQYLCKRVAFFRFKPICC